MTELQNRNLLIAAIIGAGLPSIKAAILAQSAGLADFTGNQWNESWQWNRKALADLPSEMLDAIWQKCRNVGP